MLNPESVIGEDELLPTLLSEDADSLAAALRLFDPEQIRDLLAHGAALLEKLNEQGQETVAAGERLQQMKDWYGRS